MYKYIEKFIKEYVHIYESMRATDQSYDTFNRSSHHLEGDVWAHTMMVTRLAQEYDINEIIPLAALLHDIGKPLSVTYKHEKKKKHFIGHEGISGFLALDYLKGLTEFSDKEKLDIFKLVTLHGHFYKYMQSKNFNEKLIEQFKHDKTFFINLVNLNLADRNGRVSIDGPISDYKQSLKFGPIIDEIDNGDVILDKNKKNLTILVGLPCSGKSTWASNLVNTPENEIHRISRDEFIMTQDVLGYDMTYNERFAYFRNLDGFKSIDAALSKKIGALSRDKKDNIIVDMTNMSTKSRRRITGQFNRSVYNVHIKLFLASFNEVFERNIARGKTGKFIPEDVMIDMMKRFDYPLMNEYDTLEVIV